MTMFGKPYSMQSSTGSSDISVAGETTIYTKAFKVNYATFFGLWCRASSVTGTPNILVEIQEAHRLPVTECVADTALFVEPDGFSNVFDAINDELAHIKTVTPVPMPYIRFKLTGLTGNPADALINMEVFIQEMM